MAAGTNTAIAESVTEQVQKRVASPGMLSGATVSAEAGGTTAIAESFAEKACADAAVRAAMAPRPTSAASAAALSLSDAGAAGTAAVEQACSHATADAAALRPTMITPSIATLSVSDESAVADVAAGQVCAHAKADAAALPPVMSTPPAAVMSAVDEKALADAETRQAKEDIGALRPTMITPSVASLSVSEDSALAEMAAGKACSYAAADAAVSRSTMPTPSVATLSISGESATAALAATEACSAAVGAATTSRPRPGSAASALHAPPAKGDHLTQAAAPDLAARPMSAPSHPGGAAAGRPPLTNAVSSTTRPANAARQSSMKTLSEVSLPISQERLLAECMTAEGVSAGLADLTNVPEEEEVGSIAEAMSMTVSQEGLASQAIAEKVARMPPLPPPASQRGGGGRRPSSGLRKFSLPKTSPVPEIGSQSVQKLSEEAPPQQHASLPAASWERPCSAKSQPASVALSEDVPVADCVTDAVTLAVADVSARVSDIVSMPVSAEGLEAAVITEKATAAALEEGPSSGRSPSPVSFEPSEEGLAASRLVGKATAAVLAETPAAQHGPSEASAPVSEEGLQAIGAVDKATAAVMAEPPSQRRVSWTVSMACSEEALAATGIVEKATAAVLEELPTSQCTASEASLPVSNAGRAAASAVEKATTAAVQDGPMPKRVSLAVSMACSEEGVTANGLVEKATAAVLAESPPSQCSASEASVAASGESMVAAGAVDKATMVALAETPWPKRVSIAASATCSDEGMVANDLISKATAAVLEEGPVSRCLSSEASMAVSDEGLATCGAVEKATAAALQDVPFAKRVSWAASVSMACSQEGQAAGGLVEKATAAVLAEPFMAAFSVLDASPAVSDDGLVLDPAANEIGEAEQQPLRAPQTATVVEDEQPGSQVSARAVVSPVPSDWLVVQSPAEEQEEEAAEAVSAQALEALPTINAEDVRTEEVETPVLAAALDDDAVMDETQEVSQTLDAVWSIEETAPWDISLSSRESADDCSPTTEGGHEEGAVSVEPQAAQAVVQPKVPPTLMTSIGTQTDDVEDCLAAVRARDAAAVSTEPPEIDVRHSPIPAAALADADALRSVLPESDRQISSSSAAAASVEGDDRFPEDVITNFAGAGSPQIVGESYPSWQESLVRLVTLLDSSAETSADQAATTQTRAAARSYAGALMSEEEFHRTPTVTPPLVPPPESRSGTASSLSMRPESRNTMSFAAPPRPDSRSAPSPALAWRPESRLSPFAGYAGTPDSRMGVSPSPSNIQELRTATPTVLPSRPDSHAAFAEQPLRPDSRAAPSPALANELDSRATNSSALDMHSDGCRMPSPSFAMRPDSRSAASPPFEPVVAPLYWQQSPMLGDLPTQSVLTEATRTVGVDNEGDKQGWLTATPPAVSSPGLAAVHSASPSPQPHVGAQSGDAGDWQQSMAKLVQLLESEDARGLGSDSLLLAHNCASAVLSSGPQPREDSPVALEAVQPEREEYSFSMRRSSDPMCYGYGQRPYLSPLPEAPTPESPLYGGMRSAPLWQPHEAQHHRAESRLGHAQEEEEAETIPGGISMNDLAGLMRTVGGLPAQGSSSLTPLDELQPVGYTSAALDDSAERGGEHSPLAVARRLLEEFGLGDCIPAEDPPSSPTRGSAADVDGRSDAATSAADAVNFAAPLCGAVLKSLSRRPGDNGSDISELPLLLQSGQGGTQRSADGGDSGADDNSSSASLCAAVLRSCPPLPGLPDVGAPVTLGADNELGFPSPREAVGAEVAAAAAAALPSGLTGNALEQSDSWRQSLGKLVSILESAGGGGEGCQQSLDVLASAAALLGMETAQPCPQATFAPVAETIDPAWWPATVYEEDQSDASRSPSQSPRRGGYSRLGDLDRAISRQAVSELMDMEDDDLDWDEATVVSTNIHEGETRSLPNTRPSSRQMASRPGTADRGRRPLEPLGAQLAAAASSNSSGRSYIRPQSAFAKSSTAQTGGLPPRMGDRPGSAKPATAPRARPFTAQPSSSRYGGIGSAATMGAHSSTLQGFNAGARPVAPTPLGRRAADENDQGQSSKDDPSTRRS
eukprot:TRINITY_DN39841_c1_g3_i1.p1 TRINITY_DN39841_c1_g3~~TRINITY_DN39841_c1_g3_i1.p1  ORF type:complete len:2199 (-),score=449.33 TRINITY_DN39841_c1_g3_i1:86-6256(-)